LGGRDGTRRLETRLRKGWRGTSSSGEESLWPRWSCSIAYWGLRPGVIAAAERLRAAGHTVHTPDCFDGEVFDDLEDGLRKEEALGYREIARRARESIAGLPEGLVYAGFSMGVAHAEVLAAEGPGALGAVLMHGAVPVEVLGEYFGVERWPEGVPVQVHYAADDPWVEAEGEVAPLGEVVRGAGASFEAYVYPGSGHLFADPDLPEYDRASSEEMWERVIAFLDRRPSVWRRDAPLATRKTPYGE
jgi:dienelactone hydrolase